MQSLVNQSRSFTRVYPSWCPHDCLEVNARVEMLGPTARKKQQDWFDENDEEIKEMLAEKNRLHRFYKLDQSSAAKKTAFTNIRRTVQTRLRKMPDSWLAAKEDEIQKYSDTHYSKRFYDALKAVHGPQSSSTSSLLNVDGTTLITDKPAILNKWAGHFSAVLMQQTSRYQRRSHCPPATR